MSIPFPDLARHDALLYRGKNLMNHIIKELNIHNDAFPRPMLEHRRMGDMNETCIAAALLEEMIMDSITQGGEKRGIK